MKRDIKNQKKTSAKKLSKKDLSKISGGAKPLGPGGTRPSSPHP